MVASRVSMMASSGTVGESAYDVRRGFLLTLPELLTDEPPKNGEEPTLLLTGRERREFPLLSESTIDWGCADGLLVTCLIVFLGDIEVILGSSYGEEVLA